MTKLLSPTRTGGSGTFVDPGTPDTSNWLGCAVGKPFIFDDTGNSGYYYMYFTSYKYYEEVADSFPADGWYQTIGVARSTEIDGTYTVLNDAPILEPSSDDKLWYGHNVLGCSVYDNPNSGDADLLNLTEDFTISMLLYFNGAISESFTLFSRTDSDDDEVFSIYGHSGGAANRQLFARLKVGGTQYGNVGGSATIPKAGELIYLGVTFEKSSGVMYFYLSKNSGDATITQYIFGDEATGVDDSDGGRTMVLNTAETGSFHYGNSGGDAHIMGLQINNSFSSLSNLQGIAERALALSYFPSRYTDSSGLFTGRWAGDFTYISDFSGGKIKIVNEGASWTALKGMSMDANSEYLELHSPRSEAYVMLLTGWVHSGIIGLAFSDSLTSGWTIFKPPIYNPSMYEVLIADPYKTNSLKKINGVAFPRLLEDSNRGTLLICAREWANQVWQLDLYEIDNLYVMPKSCETLRVAKGLQSSDFDFMGIPNGMAIEDTFLAKTHAVGFEGDTVDAVSGTNYHIHNIAVIGANI